MPNIIRTQTAILIFSFFLISSSLFALNVEGLTPESRRDNTPTRDLNTPVNSEQMATDQFADSLNPASALSKQKSQDSLENQPSFGLPPSRFLPAIAKPTVVTENTAVIDVKIPGDSGGLARIAYHPLGAEDWLFAEVKDGISRLENLTPDTTYEFQSWRASDGENYDISGHRKLFTTHHGIDATERNTELPKISPPVETPVIKEEINLEKGSGALEPVAEGNPPSRQDEIKEDSAAVQVPITLEETVSETKTDPISPLEEPRPVSVDEIPALSEIVGVTKNAAIIEVTLARNLSSITARLAYRPEGEESWKFNAIDDGLARLKDLNPQTRYEIQPQVSTDGINYTAAGPIGEFTTQPGERSNENPIEEKTIEPVNPEPLVPSVMEQAATGTQPEAQTEEIQEKKETNDPFAPAETEVSPITSSSAQMKVTLNPNFGFPKGARVRTAFRILNSPAWNYLELENPAGDVISWAGTLKNLDAKSIYEYQIQISADGTDDFGSVAPVARFETMP